MVKIDIKHKFLEIKLNIKKGQILAVVGASGSGKTTLLRVIAGLEEASGLVEVFGEKWLMNNRSLAVQNRSLGFVMQEYGLFENMSVLDNLLFVEDNLNLAKRLLKELDILDLSNRYPKTLSGGQKQRVALARAVIKKPKVLLLDEPLSSLDTKMRIKLQEYILKLHKEFDLTTIMVSHDLAEVYKMADSIAKIEQGRLKSLEYKQSEQALIKLKLVDKKANSNKYEFIVELNGLLNSIEVDSKTFNKYSVGDLVDLKVE